MRRARLQWDRMALIGILVIAIGWFGMATLTADFALVQHNPRFYELWAVINDPLGALSGMNRSQDFLTFGFALVCVVALAASLAPVVWPRRIAWFAYLIPLLVMAYSLYALYAKTSTTYVAVDDSVHTLNAYIARITQSAMNRAGEASSKRISIGAGTYVALLGSVLLAARGIFKFVRAADKT